MLRVAIFLLKHEMDSLIFSGKEFQTGAPSYIKLNFFILLLLGFGKRIDLYEALANVILQLVAVLLNPPLLKCATNNYSKTH